MIFFKMKLVFANIMLEQMHPTTKDKIFPIPRAIFPPAVRAPLRSKESRQKHQRKKRSPPPRSPFRKKKFHPQKLTRCKPSPDGFLWLSPPPARAKPNPAISQCSPAPGKKNGAPQRGAARSPDAGDRFKKKKAGNFLLSHQRQYHRRKGA